MTWANHLEQASVDLSKMGRALPGALRRWVWIALLPLFLLGCGGGGGGTERAEPAATGELRSKVAKAVSWPPAPVVPETGWYWNPAEGGTGFMFEAQGNRAFVGFFMYEESTGAPIWYVASGDVTSEAGAPVFTGDLRLYLISTGKNTSTSVGTVRVVFDGRNATASLPGGRTMPATRFDIAGGGYDFDRAASITREQPEAGWYWDPTRPGSGYAIEVQNGRMFVGIFDYSTLGRPTWSIVDTPVEAGIAAASTTRYADGQTLTSAHRSPYADLTGFATLTFANSCTGRIQRDFSSTIDIRRFRVDDSPLAPGAECREGALGRLAAPGGSPRDAKRLRLGETVEAEIRTPGEVHVYAVFFPNGDALEGFSYGFTLETAASGRGSLASPLLSVHGSDGRNSPSTQVWPRQRDEASSTLRCSTDRRGGCYNSYSAAVYVPGVYYIVVRAADQGTGTYRLVTDDSDEYRRQTARESVSKSAAGRYIGRATGRLGGRLDIMVDANGVASGSWAKDSAGGSPELVPLTGVMYSEYLGLAGPAGHADLYLHGLLTPVDGVFTGVWQDSTGPGGVFAATSDHVPQEILGGVVGPNRVQAGMAEFFRSEHLDAQWRYTDMGSSRFLPEQYRWRVISAPAGSRSQLFSPQGHSNWFTADLPGDYRLEVTLSETNGRVTTGHRTVTAFAPPVLAFYDPGTNPVSLAFVEPTGQDTLTELDTDVPVAVQLLLNGTPSGRSDYAAITLSSDNPAIQVLGGPMKIIRSRGDGRAVFALRSCIGGSAELTAVSSGQYGSAHTVPIQMRVQVPPSRAAC